MASRLEIIVATENRHKVVEFQRLLGDFVELKSLNDVDFDRELPPEGETSFRENAEQKAKFVGKELQKWVIADDSGFEVDALQKAPGVISARFGGSTDPQKQRQLVLEMMHEKKNRASRFVCELALFRPSEDRLDNFRGEIEGHLAFEERGTNGFGYDPIFVPESFSQTFAEMSAEEKDRLSHRGRAVAQLKSFLEKISAT